MSGDLRLVRVEAKLKEFFHDKITYDDLRKDASAEDKANAELTRNLAACAVNILTNADYDLCGKSITDGFKDNGIDAIYVDDQDKKLVLVQSKWSKNATGSIEVGELHKFISGAKKLTKFDFTDFNDRVIAKKNKIQESLADIDYCIELVIIYSSDAKFSDECETEMKTFLESINQNDDNEIVKYRIIKLKEVYDFLAKGTASTTVDIENVDIRDWGVVEHNENVRSYYGTISAEMLVTWWDKFKTQLLEKNIRSFKGDTEVNKNIIRVLVEEPENFIYYNNGIKLVANNVARAAQYSTDRKVGIFSFENASIVNGAQTYGSIAEAFKVNPEQVKKAKVFIHVVNLKNQHDKFGEFVTRASNTQNKVDGKDFASLDPTQEKLRNELLMDGIDYIYKTGETSSSYIKMCNLDEATVSLACFSDDLSVVTTVKRAYGSIFDNIEKAPYKKIFNSSTSSYTLWNSVLLYREMDKMLVELNSTSTGIKSLIIAHGNRFITHITYDIIKNSITNFKSSYFEYDVDFLAKVRTVMDLVIDEIVNVKNILFVEAYPANIFKNNSRCSTIKDEIVKQFDRIRDVAGLK